MDDDNRALGSNELLREAKQALRSRPGGFTAEVAGEDVDDPVAGPVSTRVPSSRPVAQPAVISPANVILPAEPATRRRGKAARIVGIFLLIVVVVFWLILGSGLWRDEIDVGSALLGGAVMSALPLLLGLYLVHRATRAKNASDHGIGSKLGYGV